MRTAVAALARDRGIPPEDFGELGLASFRLRPLTLPFRPTAETFTVEEIPLYAPQGTGEHMYLWVEKRDLSAGELKEGLRRALGLGPADVGMAGMKDKAATTRQWVSVPAKAAEAWDGEGIAGVRVLERARHANKLRTGHLAGNRFHVVATAAAGADAALAAAYAACLAQGFPNFYGRQRFGDRGDTALMGERLLRGDRDVPRRFRGHDGLKLALSAWQSRAFNAYLMQRWAEGSERTVLAGDVLMKGNGACFVVEDPAAEQARLDAGEVAVTGPMFGDAMRAPAGEAAAREAEVLAAQGIPEDALRAFRKNMPGSRRPLWVMPQDLRIACEDADKVAVSFTLPPGSYATVLLAELAGVALGDENDASRTRHAPGPADEPAP